MTKRNQLNMRLDDYYDDLINEMVKKLQNEDSKKDKSKVVREALEFYAVHVLGQDEVMNLRLYKHFHA